MNTGEILSTVISGISVLILASLARGLMGMRNDFRRFMAEHVWLLASTLWNRDKVMLIMRKLDMPVTDPPPDELKPR